MRYFALARRGFTLVELLAVLAILSLIAGLLFPVFASVRRTALRTSCVANFKSAALGTLEYATDYDDRLLPSNHRPGLPPDAALDRTWPQLLLPYVKDFRIFDCPSEPNPMEFGGAFDPDLLPGDYAARYYAASLHSDLGYNAYYLSPILRVDGAWIAMPIAGSETRDPSRTLLYVESRGADGKGSYLVAPPCRYLAGEGGRVDTFLPSSIQIAKAEGVYAPVEGWNLDSESTRMPYGGAWPRHGDRLNVARLDGGAASTSLPAISAGCDVRSAWGGVITDAARYLWYPGA